MELVLIFLFSAQLLLSEAQTIKQERERKIVLDLLKNYDPGQRPSADGSPFFTRNGASLVEVNMYLRALGPVNTKEMEFNTDITLRQRWRDPRLKYRGGDIKVVQVPGEGRVWTPDTFIRNDKESAFFMVPNKASYLRVFPDGSVLQSVRIKSTHYCLLDLRLYPFDQQECHIDLASYSYNTDDLVYTWKKESPVLTHHTALPHFDFVLTSNSTTDDTVVTSTATYSFVKAVFSLRRMSAYYVTTQLVPLSMLVVTSIITLWMPSDNNNLKIGINILLLLASSFKAENINNSLPFSNYTKAIDIYTGCTTMFIFLSVLVSAFWQSPPAEEGKERRLATFTSWSRPSKASFLARATLTAGYVLFVILYGGYYGSK